MTKYEKGSGDIAKDLGLPSGTNEKWKARSTFDRLMEDPDFAKEFEKQRLKLEKQEKKLYFARQQKEMKRIQKKYSKDLKNE